LAIRFRPFGFIAPKLSVVWPYNISILSVPDKGYSKKRRASEIFSNERKEMQ
jgi:hypothetical protein